MDYFGMPHIKTRMVGPPVFVDVANNVAAVPGTGNEPIVLTYSFDLARFVDGLLHLADWPQHSILIGDKLTWNEFVKLAENARGESHVSPVEIGGWSLTAEQAPSSMSAMIALRHLRLERSLGFRPTKPCTRSTPRKSLTTS